MPEIVTTRKKIFGRTFQRTMPLSITRTGDLTAEIVLLNSEIREQPYGNEQLLFSGGALSPAGISAVHCNEISINGEAAPIVGRATLIKSLDKLAVAVEFKIAKILDALTSEPGTVTVSYSPRRYQFDIKKKTATIDAFQIQKIEVQTKK